MALCASCGNAGADDLCPHHIRSHGDGWASVNRIMCDFFHRGKVPPRLGPAERDEAVSYE